MTVAVEIDQYLAELRAVLQDAGEQRPTGALESTGGIAWYRRQIDP